MQIVAFVVVVAAVALAACRPTPPPGRDVETIDSAPPRPPAPPSASSGVAPSTPPTGGCDAIVARFNGELAKRTDTCKSSADCACHGAEGGGCGGVTDRATADRLAPISAEFHAAGCKYAVQCAATACAPKCLQGRCSP